MKLVTIYSCFDLKTLILANGSDKMQRVKDTVDDLLVHENFDLNTIVTPVKADELKNLLQQAGYDGKKTQFLYEGFTQGFSLKYNGILANNVRRFAPNLKLRVGSKLELWNKIMKEVELGHYAGPFDEPPFEYFVQSPIGLVPKDKGKKT